MGIILSCVNSFVVNSTLIEISFNTFFAMVNIIIIIKYKKCFGSTFLFVGISIFFRVYTDDSEIILQKKKFLLTASILVQFFF